MMKVAIAFRLRKERKTIACKREAKDILLLGNIPPPIFLPPWRGRLRRGGNLPPTLQ